jgi:predicted enzyme related to lactoylglutathione lyase
MAKVIGVGGVFFKAQDPEAVRAWYARVLGVEFASWGGTHWTNAPDSVSVLTLFKPDTDKFNPSTQPFMLNLIVEDMDGVLAKAKAAGETPLGAEDSDFGKFAWLMDPAGVKIELWEPK